MKRLLLVLILSSPVASHGDEAFTNKLYTPEVVFDSQNQGPKGAVQLLWQKSAEQTQYEIEISNGASVYSDVGNKNYKHLMLYFNKDYQWRVRQVSAKRATKFSSWRELRVVPTHKTVKPNQQQRQPVSISSHSEVEEFMLDVGE